jgi:hypothetical protein
VRLPRYFEAIAREAICAYDKIIGLDLTDVAVDGCVQKSPAGGQGTGKNPTDRTKLGWKWSVSTERNGIPISWATEHVAPPPKRPTARTRRAWAADADGAP